MPLEIERKFLVTGSFKEFSFKNERITQGYLSTDPKRTVRIRRIGDKAYITIKGKSSDDGISRYEWEKEIPYGEAIQLLSLCESSSIIDKTRYYIKANNDLLFEVDEFHELNEGLVIAEIELTNENQNFEHPSWLDKEVTGNIKYYNSYLSKHPYSKWEKAND